MLKLAGITLCAIFLAGCSNNSEKFLGTWADVKDQNQQLVITKDGDTFYVQHLHPNVDPKVANTQQVAEKPVPGTIKDDMLVTGVFGSIGIDESGKLQLNGTQLVKIK